MQGFIGGFLYEKLTIVHGRTILPSWMYLYTLRHYERDRYNLNMWTILFAVMATIDFNLALRLILVKFTKKKQ